MAVKVLQHDETAITWKATGGTKAFTPTSLAAGAGRQGALNDFLTSARARRFAWRAYLKPGATRVIGETVRVLFKTSDGVHPDNDDGTGDIAVSAADKLRNVRPLGSIVIDESAAVEMVSSGVIDIVHQWGGPIFWNDTANSLSATAADFGFILTPIPMEIQ